MSSGLFRRLRASPSSSSILQHLKVLHQRVLVCFVGLWLVYDDLTDVIIMQITMIQRNTGTVGTEEHRNSRHRGTVDTEEHRNSRHRGTVGTEEQ